MVSFCLLVLFGFLSGLGGNGGLASAMNSTAKSFPDRARATTNGVVLSGFGLSAFLFSTIAHVVFPGDTSSFLLVLAIGTSLPMVLGFFLVRPIPLPFSELTHNVEHAVTDEDDEDVVTARVGSPTIFQRENNSHTHLLSPHLHHHHHTDEEDDVQELLLEEQSLVSHLHQSSVSSDYVVPVLADSVALSPTRSESRQRSRSEFSASHRRRRLSSDADVRALDGLPNIHGKGLFASSDFWLLFTVTALLSGTGLMYINNVGSISQALFAKGNPDYDGVKASQWQATQVSVISVMNCLGRIGIGILADFTKTYLHHPRSCCITLIAALFILSQVMLYNVENVGELWKTSAVLGSAYGCLFGLFPTLTIEWFGLSHFSENWGFVSLSPMIGSNVLSIAFGRNLDAHVPESETRLNNTITSVASVPVSPFSTASVALPGFGPPSAHQCLDGRSCYVDTLKLTLAACCLGLALAVYAGWRDRRRQHRLGLGGAEVSPEIVWTEQEG
ncbi:predicted protein [Sparassis crispa]|uniref:MFS general substrate transporter n=1 Tax=Sparassis crispa TaxID=139825 RepID=A0A401GA50_9APHY|nr:predicted protein [Sparassis crispa]GBE79045.1 predicted protein [Sparassis crispa]